VTPPDQDVYRPNSRPISAAATLEEASPEPLHRGGVEPDRCNRLRVPQGLVHGVLQSAADPAIKRHHEPTLGPIEQRGVKAAQTNAPTEGYTIGASGGVFGVLLAFAWYFPRQRLYVIPIPIPLPVGS